MLNYIITGIIVLFIAGAIVSAIWRLSKILMYGFAILSFLLIIFIVFKVFFTTDNLKALHQQVEKADIPNITQKAIMGAKDNLSKPDVNSANQKTAVPVEAQTGPQKKVQPGPQKKVQKETQNITPAQTKPVQTVPQQQTSKESKVLQQGTPSADTEDPNAEPDEKQEKAKQNSPKPAKKKSVFDEFDDLNVDL